MSVPKIHLFLMFLFLGLWGLKSAGAQTPKITIRLSEIQIVFGDLLEVEVQRSWPLGATASPWVNEDVGLESVEETGRETLEVGDLVKETIRLRGRVFSVDTWTRPALFLAYRTLGSEDEVLIEIPAQVYPVKSALTSHNESEVELPRGPIPIADLHRPEIGVLVATVILFFSLAYFLIRRFSCLEETTTPEDAPHVALKEVLIDMEQGSALVSLPGERVSEILRSFMNRWLAIPALELTPMEIRRRLVTETDLDDNDIQLFFDVLMACDEEKYGKARIEDEKWSQIIPRCISSVKEIQARVSLVAKDDEEGSQ